MLEFELIEPLMFTAGKALLLLWRWLKSAAKLSGYLLFRFLPRGDSMYFDCCSALDRSIDISTPFETSDAPI